MRRIIQGHLTRVSLAVSFSALFFAIIWIAGRATPLAQFLAGASIVTVFAHAIAALGWLEALSFLTICLAVTFTVENFGVLTGFPFGHYTFLVEPNIPHIGVIPPIVGLLYFGMGYPSWVIANLLLGQSVQRPSTRLQLFAVPMISAFVMVQWDVVMDPSGSTLARAWVWYGGGGYFGVPLSNFLGWFLVTYLYYQAFSLFLYARGTRPPYPSARVPSGHCQYCSTSPQVSATSRRSSIRTSASSTPAAGYGRRRTCARPP